MSYTSEYRVPTPAERRQIMIEARRLQSQAFLDVFRAIAHGVSRFAANVAAIRRRAVMMRELSLLNDRELQDMGITRADFPGIVAGTYTRESAASVVVATPAIQAVPASRPQPANDALPQDRRIAA